MAKADAFIPLDFSPLEEHAMQHQAESLYLQMSKRRSVREFSDQPIPTSVLEYALLTAGAAPSGANMQPWHFVVVQSPEIKKSIR